MPAGRNGERMGIGKRMTMAGLATLVAAPVALAQDPLGPSAPPAPGAKPPRAARTPAPPPRLPAGVIAPGVTIDGVDVAGLTRVPATQAVLAQRVRAKRRPLVVTFRGRRIGIDPVRAGYSADVAYAVKAALKFGHGRPAPARVDVPLRERVSLTRIRAFLEARAPDLEVAPRNAALYFAGGRPRVQPARVGVRIDTGVAARLVAQAILTRRFPQYALPARRLRPEVTTTGPAVVIDRGAFRLTLYRGEHVVRAFPIAVGQSAYPTPTGQYRIVTKQVNPTWFPPSSPWAAGLGPVPPGVENPLGTRWMGTSAPAIGIHGTPVAGSVGTPASHGCIRMYIHDAEWLYDHVDIGTPLLIT